MSRDLHALRERAGHSRTETWSRQDVERLFSVSRALAQSLMRAIGSVQTVGATHFVDRASLLALLEQMIAAESVETALLQRLAAAKPPPRPKPSGDLASTPNNDIENGVEDVDLLLLEQLAEGPEFQFQPLCSVTVYQSQKGSEIFT